MKRFLLLTILFLSLSSSFAQTQQGIVKTRGRMTATGVVIPGTRLSGATVNMRNLSSVVSNNKGSFSFVLHSKAFYLTSVQKQGYMLCDNDILNKSHQYSENPLVVVMETPENNTADRLAAEKKIRRTLQRQLQDKEDEIEALKAEQKITETEYNKKLQELYAQQKKNDNLIEDMAKRYSTIDFDEMDEFQRKVAFYIQNGELMRADSLLNTKGSMDARSAELDRMDAAIKTDAEDLAKRQAAHDESVKMKAKALEDFAADCYSRFEICKLQHKNDSAAYWLELRASKDTTNSYWHIQCGSFLLNYLADYEKAEIYTKKVVDILNNDSDCSNDARGEGLFCLADVYLKCGKYEDAIRLYTEVRRLHGEKSEGFVAATVALADCYGSIEENAKALEYLREAYSVYQQMNYNTPRLLLRIYNELTSNLRTVGKFDEAQKFLNLTIELMEKDETIDQPKQIVVYIEAASFYSTFNMFEKSETYYNKALEICQIIYDDKHPMLASIYNGLGVLYYNQGNMDKALDYLLKAKEVNKEKPYGEGCAQECSNIASIYMAKGNLDLAEQYEMEAYKIRLRLFGEDGSAMIKEYNALGALYFEKGDLKTSEHYLKKAITIRKKESGDMHPSLFSSNSFLGGICMQLGKLDEALDWFQQNLEIAKHYYGEEDARVAETYNNIGGVYLYLKKYDDAIVYLDRSLKIHLSVYGENHLEVAGDYNGLAQTYMAMERYEDAITNFNKAIEIRKNVFGANSIKLKSLYGFMKEIYQKLGNNEKVRYYDSLINEIEKQNSHT